MNTNVIIIGLVVGTANYLFRYLPLRFSGRRKSIGTGGNWAGLLLDGIGIASICALLVVSSVPEVMRDPAKLAPTLAGFAILIACFYQTRSIVISTLGGALCFGLVFKLLSA
ncbi:L-valine transporter subunit YgaH [Acerihabitans arboris]|uniref:L-valine transporter subunit YgaH n=1 Tax=Acerihabitans arboris TaxID=2691583 RepID=A0A845SN17_9GAMM|nr:L-valine transporter subunit YgaH [Acerihabitans arboris]NDL63948.1 L-valine transporter subunit YgaH [Acerihabitans arboris]